SLTSLFRSCLRKLQAGSKSVAISRRCVRVVRELPSSALEALDVAPAQPSTIHPAHLFAFSFPPAAISTATLAAIVATPPTGEATTSAHSNTATIGQNSRSTIISTTSRTDCGETPKSPRRTWELRRATTAGACFRHRSAHSGIVKLQICALARLETGRQPHAIWGGLEDPLGRFACLVRS